MLFSLPFSIGIIRKPEQFLYRDAEIACHTEGKRSGGGINTVFNCVYGLTRYAYRGREFLLGDILYRPLYPDGIFQFASHGYLFR